MFLPYRGLNGSSPLHISRESHCLQIGGDPHQVLGWRGPKYGNTALIKCRVKTEDVVVLLLSLRPLCSVDWRNLKLAIRIRLMWTETAYFGRSDGPSVPSSVWRPPNSSPMANVWEMKDRTAGFQHSRFPLFSGEIGPTQRSQAVAHSPLLIQNTCTVSWACKFIGWEVAVGWMSIRLMAIWSVWSALVIGPPPINQPCHIQDICHHLL